MIERNYPKILFYFGLLGAASYAWVLLAGKLREEIEEEI